MEVNANTPRGDRQIGGKRAADAAFGAGEEVAFTVKVPQPFAPGPIELTEGLANILNQTIAENVSNNLRAKLLAGTTDGEGTPLRDLTGAEAQKMVDDYIAEYEPGVRRAGSGEPRITDPVEREGRAIAKQKAKEMVTASGMKPADVDMVALTNGIFEKNRDALMAAGKKIVDAANKASAGATLDLGIELVKKAPPAPAA